MFFFIQKKEKIGGGGGVWRNKLGKKSNKVGMLVYLFY